jgi:hypothetical protein
MIPLDTHREGANEEMAMDSETREARMACIAEMEEAFDQSVAALLSLRQALRGLESAQSAIDRLAAYYGSDEWFADREADEAGEFPSNMRRGVLGEDLPYEALVDYQQLAIRMLELGTHALKV